MKKFLVKMILFLIIFISLCSLKIFAVESDTYIINIYYLPPSEIASQLSNEFKLSINSDKVNKTIIFYCDKNLYDKILNRIEEIDIDKNQNTNQSNIQSLPNDNNETGTDEIKTELILIQNFPATDFEKIIKDAFPSIKAIKANKVQNGILITAYKNEIESVKKFLSAIDKKDEKSKTEAEVLEPELESKVFKINYMSAEKLSEYVLNHFTKSIVTLNKESNMLIISDRPEKMHKIETFIRELDVSSNSVVTEIIPVVFNDIENVKKILLSMFDIQKVEIDEKNRKLIITTVSSQLYKIKEFLDKFDIEPPTILVEGTILSIKIGEAKQFGVKYEHSALKKYDVNEEKFTNEPVVDFTDANGNPIEYGKTTGQNVIGSFTAGQALSQVMYQFTSKTGKVHEISLKALIDNNIAESILKPHITFVSGKSGSFEQNENIPLKTIINGAPKTDIMAVGLTLKVGGIAFPYTESDSKSGQKYKIIITELKLTDGSKTGEESSRETIFECEQILEDGELIILGGAISDKDEKKISKVPLLGDIPIVKNLFRYNDSSKTATEMLALLRLTVMKEESYKFKAAQFYKSKELRPIEFGGGVNDSIQEHPLKSAKWSSKIIYEKKGGYFEYIHERYSEEFMEKVDRQFKKQIRSRIKLVQEWGDIKLVKMMIFRDEGLKKAFEDFSKEVNLSPYKILIITRHLGSINDIVYTFYYDFLEKNKLLVKEKK